MGGRGGASGVGSGNSLSESIKRDMINQGLNSNIAGIRKKAEQGIGNYSFKNAKPVNAKTAEQLTNNVKVHEKNGNTLVEGITSKGTHVYYANKSNSPEIKKILAKKAERADAAAKAAAHRADQDLTGKTTTTYDRWAKNNRRKFDNYYFGTNGKK